MHPSRLTCVLLLAMALAVSMGMTSCGGSAGGDNPDLVLVGFNLPNLAGIPLNQPLIFTFSANIDPSSITPDSLRVVGSEGPFFETTVVDGNLVALLPRSPNFETYEDAGLAPGVTYTVSLTTFPAVTTIESETGKPLLEAESFTFVTQPFPVFIEPRRPVAHGVPWTLGGRSDDGGCLQNSGNALYVSPQTDPGAIQTGSSAGATLLCLQNEGAPRVVEFDCTPRHNQQAIGRPSAVEAGLIELPAIRVRVNENLDPLTIAPWFDGVPVNVQLWRVAFKDGTFTGPDRIRTNKPVVVQNTAQTEIILVPQAPVPQGVYLVNITPSVKDLPGNSLRFDDRPDPALNGYDLYEGMSDFGKNIVPGYRIYFKTLEVPDTPLAIVEDFVNNIHEMGDNDSLALEPGLFSETVTPTNPLSDNGGTFPNRTLTFAVPDPVGAYGGQSTSAAWNVDAGGATLQDINGYRFLNLPSLIPNPSINNPKPGTLQANLRPWAGNGGDQAFDSGGGGSVTGWNTDTGSINGDGIFEVESFNLRQGDTLSVTGSRPLLILCKGDFVLDGTLQLKGQNGSPGFDTDGSGAYTHANAAAWYGAGGAGGPGGGAGGDGADPEAPGGPGKDAGGAVTLFEQDLTSGGAGATFFSDGGGSDGSGGGGGGGFDGNGSPGLTAVATQAAAGGLAFGDAQFQRAIALFRPDRAYHPSANISGGGGGGGGSSDDDNGATEAGDGSGGPGDDAGGGGGGGGGAFWAIVGGDLSVGALASIDARGGIGGNTYGPADQAFDPGDDGMAGTADDIFSGLLGNPATGTGQGGPGGGGAGGAVFLLARGSLTVAAGATVDARGGAGGTSGDADRAGGLGADGRVTFMTFDGGGTVTNASVTINPTPSVLDNVWSPTVDTDSVGQSDWTDLFTSNTVFDPMAGTPPMTVGPNFHANFSFPGSAPGSLQIPVADGGSGQTIGADFDAAFEFQGAGMVSASVPGGKLDTATGLTEWVDRTMIAMINGSRFVRWRWRFTVRDDWGGPADPANLPLPTVFDLTIPFVKN